MTTPNREDPTVCSPEACGRNVEVSRLGEWRLVPLAEVAVGEVWRCWTRENTVATWVRRSARFHRPVK